MPEVAFLDFEAASRAVLAHLHSKLGFGLWMVTRTEGEHWVVLQAEDHGYDVTEGTVFRWADSFCSRMVADLGPRIAPRAHEIPVYASAPIAQLVKIGSYIGVPLTSGNGVLFGTLCAIDPETMPETVMQEQELVELLAALLSGLLQRDLQAEAGSRRLERVQMEALSDALTGLYNRRGWTRLLEAEERRCRRHGHPASVIVIDLDGLKSVNDAEGHFKGDELLVRASAAISSVARNQDVVARVGGDEFALLAVECDRAGVGAFLSRLRGALDGAGVQASIGWATRVPAEGLHRAWEQADEAMYADKARQRDQ